MKIYPFIKEPTRLVNLDLNEPLLYFVKNVWSSIGKIKMEIVNFKCVSIFEFYNNRIE